MDVLIVDGNNLAYKCRHSFNLSTPNGLDCSVTYGFLSVLSSYAQKFQPDAIVVTWDGGIPRYRREALEVYKANRNHGDPLEYSEFKRQLVEVDEALRMMGVMSVREPWIEADDLMYHAAYMASPFYDQVIVVSSDKDLLQAVNIADNVLVWNANNDVLMDAAWLEQQHGIPATAYCHWRALQGDTSDNIEGVKQIGPKRATDLFQQYNNSLSMIMNAARGDYPGGKITGSMAQNLILFGDHRLVRNVYVMALAFDRAGSRIALWRELDNWRPMNLSALREWLMERVFVSLADPTFYAAFRRLRKPTLDDEVTMPVVAHYRHPAQELQDEGG